MVVYADDIALYQIIIHSLEDYFLVQYDIDAVLEWTTANYLAFNYRKCCHLQFTQKIYPSSYSTGDQWEYCEPYKYLGVILSSSLPFSLTLENLLGFFIKSSISIRKHIPSYICTSH